VVKPQDAAKTKPPVASTATAVNQRRKKMKKQVYNLIAMFALVVSLAVAANAQTNGSRIQLMASVPYEFNVAGKSMPAGEYLVRQVNPSSDRAVLQIASRDGKASAMVLMDTVIDIGKAHETAVLKFRRCGNERFFAEAWIPGNHGLAAPMSRTERGRTELAGLKPQIESVALRRR
jgi:hypothetical protein